MKYKNTASTYNATLYSENDSWEVHRLSTNTEIINALYNFGFYKRK
jgi:hypothetical protein